MCNVSHAMMTEVLMFLPLLPLLLLLLLLMALS
jgi:hypothetical protein